MYLDIEVSSPPECLATYKYTKPLLYSSFITGKLEGFQISDPKMVNIPHE